ncbi:MAG: methyltransferase domain-containing protein [Deltaproteobacteria bacterium]|nr:methyltransferase domain-containing protein [Deltaproteobacteria bacterium]
MSLYATDKPWGDILPRYIFLESLLVDKKVLELGCNDGTGTIFIKDREAQEVVGFDLEGPFLEKARSREPRAGVSFQAFDGRRIDLPTATIDVVIDFELAAREDNGLLAEIQRVLKPTGYLVTILQTPDHTSIAELIGNPEERALVSYEEFVSRLQRVFPRLTVLGQTPFLGFSVGWMGAEAEDLPLEMDNMLIEEEHEELAYYILVCGPEPLSFETQSLIELPYRSILNEMTEQLVEYEDDEGENLEAKEGTSTLASQQVENELAVVRQRVSELETRITAEQSKLEVASKYAAKMEEQLEAERSQMNDLKDRFLNSESEHDGFQEEVIRLRSENEVLSRSTQELDEVLVVREGELEHNRQSIVQMQKLVRHREEEVAEKLSWLEGARAEVEHLQLQLKDQQSESAGKKARIKELEKELLVRAKVQPDNEVFITTLRQENEGLKLSLRKLGRDLTDMLKKQVDWEDERRRLETSARDRKNMFDQVRAQIDDLQKERDQLLAGRTEVQQVVDSQSETLDSLKAVEQKLIQEKHDFVEEIGKLNLALEDTRGREKSLATKRNNLETEVEKNHREISRLSKQLATQTGLVVGLEGDLTKRQDQLRELETDLVEMVNRLEDGQAREHDRRRLVEELQGRITHQHEDLDDAREKITELTKELYSARKHEEELAQQMENRRGSILEQERAREALEIEISNLRVGEQDDLKQLKERLKKAEHRLAIAVREGEKEAEELERLKQGADSLRMEIAHKDRELQRVRDQLMASEDRLENVKAINARVTQFEQEIVWFREEADRLNGELAAKSEELEQAQFELEGAHDELENAQEELDRTVRDSAHSVADREELRNRIEQATQASQEKERIIAEIRAANEQLEESLKQGRDHKDQQRAQIQEHLHELEEARQGFEREHAQSEILAAELDRLRGELREAEGPAKEELKLALEREQTLQARVSSLQQQMGELREKTSDDLSTLGEQLRRREEQMGTMMTSLAQMETQVAQKEAQLGELQAQVEQLKALTADITEMEERARIAEMKYNQLTEKDSQAQLAEQKIEQLEADLSKKEQLALSAETKAKELKEQLGRAQARVSTVSPEEKVKREAELAGTRRRVEELEAQLGKQRQEASQQVQLLSKKVAGFEKELAAERAQGNSPVAGNTDGDTDLRADLVKSERRIGLLERQLADRAARINHLVAELSQLRRQR